MRRRFHKLRQFSFNYRSTQREVAAQIIEELLVLANDGDQAAALKLGQTYTQLFVTPDYKSAYVWLSIAQAYGLEEVQNS